MSVRALPNCSLDANADSSANTGKRKRIRKIRRRQGTGLWSWRHDVRQLGGRGVVVVAAARSCEELGRSSRGRVLTRCA